MPIQNKNFYNSSSSQTLGWDPAWFGVSDFNEELVSAISEFQKKKGLKPDGLCGPTTYKYILAERTAAEALVLHRLKTSFASTQESIVCGEKRIPIAWEKFVGMNEPGAMVADRYFVRRVKNKVNRLIVLHHDVCLSSKDCFRVLNKRGLSINFMVDCDGTVYQSVDCADSAQQAGSVNSWSVGIEVCNPLEVKYNTYYTTVKKLPPRPIIKSQKIHGKVYKNFLGYYPEQIQALEVLVKSLCEGLDIPKQTPDSSTVFPGALNGSYTGVIAHYHLTKDKWDIAGIDIAALIERIK